MARQRTGQLDVLLGVRVGAAMLSIRVVGRPLCHWVLRWVQYSTQRETLAISDHTPRP